MKGYTLMHEHVFIDLSKVKNNDDCRLDAKKEMIEEFKNLHKNGVSRIVEVTNIGMGRDIDYIKEVEEKSGIEIVVSTGYYKEPFLPSEIENLTPSEIGKVMISEAEEGIKGRETIKKPRIIGEIGTSLNKMTPLEEKIFKGAVEAHLKTNLPITTHTSLGSMALEQIKLLKDGGVKSEKIIIGHLDLTGDLLYIKKVLDQGVYVEFDTIGKENYLSDEKRVEVLVALIEEGYRDKLLLSMDITRKSNMEYQGGIGYNYLFTNFIPRLYEKGVSVEDVEVILRDNPNKILGSIEKIK